MKWVMFLMAWVEVQMANPLSHKQCVPDVTRVSDIVLAADV